MSVEVEIRSSVSSSSQGSSSGSGDNAEQHRAEPAALTVQTAVLASRASFQSANNSSASASTSTIDVVGTAIDAQDGRASASASSPAADSPVGHDGATPQAGIPTASRRGSSSSTGNQLQRTITAFQVQLDDNRTTFVPGQRIEGHVALTIVRECVLKVLRVRFSGAVQTHIDRRRKGPNVNAQNTVMPIFREVLNVLGSHSSREQHVRLAAGEYIFPFAFRVPPTSLPASFEGPYGSIVYEISSVIIRTGKPKLAVYLPITIPSTLDVAVPEYQEPRSLEMSCGVGRLWWKTGHVGIKASIPRNGYTSEENIPLKIEIVNHSPHGILLYDIAIKQRTLYKSFAEVRGPRTERIHKINFTEKIPASTRKVTRLVQFPIPSASVIPPTIQSSLMIVTHTIGFKVHSTAPWSRPCKIQMPIVVGGFPYMLFDERLTRRSVDTLPIYERHDSMFLVPSRRPRGIDEGGDAGESIDEEEEEGSRADVDSRALSETADTIDLEEMYGPGRMAVVGPNSSYAGSSLASMSIGNLRHSASASTHRLDLDVAADEETGAGTGAAHRDALSPLVLETRSTRDSSDSERSDDGDIGITGGDLVLSPQATDGDDQPVVLVVKNSSANSGNTSTGTNRHHDSGFADDGDDGDVASGKPRSMVARRAVSYPGPAEQEMLKSKQQQQQREWAADRVDALLLTAASDERPGSADSLDTAASGSSSLVLEADPSACAQSPLSPLSLGTDGLYLNEGVHSDATVSSAASAALVPSAVVVA